MTPDLRPFEMPLALRIEGDWLLLRPDGSRLVLRLVERMVVERRRVDGSAPAPLEHLLACLRASVRGTAEVADEDVLPASESHIDSRTAAQLLGRTDRHVRGIARSLGGRQIAGRWVFDRSEVEAYRDQRDHHQGRKGA